MPAPVRNLIITPENLRYQVAAEPVHNTLHSMMLLLRVDELSGLDDWIVETAASLPKQTLQQHAVILFGVHFAIVPKRRFESFPAYLEHLASADAHELSDQLLDTYMQIPPLEGTPVDMENVTKDEILADVDTFLEFLRTRFKAELIFEDIERKAFGLLKDPERMQREIVDHLTMMWEDYFQAEFERRQPIIDETVAAFSEIDLEGMSDEEAVRYVTGQWCDKMCSFIEEHERIIFVPSPHVGPYSGPLMAGDTLWLMFSCRLPKGSPLGLTEVSRAELLVWLSALADDTRLHILAMLKQRGELCSQEIITMLDTSQSTVSRHLRQLSASGYVREHRTEAGKCYRLNLERFDDTINALQSFAA